MVDKNLFGHLIKIIFLLIGIYLIVVNIVSLVVYSSYYASLDSALDYTTFSGWHNYQPIKFHGFSWFFDRLESFPGFNQLTTAIHQWQDYVTTGLTDNSTWGTISYVIGLIALPFKALWALFVDLILSIIWFFSFFAPIK